MFYYASLAPWADSDGYWLLEAFKHFHLKYNSPFRDKTIVSNPREIQILGFKFSKNMHKNLWVETIKQLMLKTDSDFKMLKNSVNMHKLIDHICRSGFTLMLVNICTRFREISMQGQISDGGNFASSLRTTRSKCKGSTNLSEEAVYSSGNSILSLQFSFNGTMGVNIYSQTWVDYFYCLICDEV